MTQRRRKLLGTIATLVVLVVYAWLASDLYAAFLTGAAGWLLLLYFALAGLLWVGPVGFIIRWMVRPDGREP